MASRKEQKEALKREREARETKARTEKRRKQLMGYGVAGAIVLAVVVVIGVLALGDDSSEGGASASDGAEVFPAGGSVPAQKVTDLKTAAADAACRLKSDRNNTAEHTQSLSDRVKYRTNPPTSGRHYIQVPDDGAYPTPLQDEQFVHNMEHGRIIIWMSPRLPADERADLKALFDEDTYQMVITPRRNMPYAVATTAWTADPAPEGAGHLMLCDKYTPQVIDAIRSFRDEYRGNGPEPVP